MQYSITSFLSSDEPLVYAKWRFEENYYAGKIESVENHSCLRRFQVPINETEVKNLRDRKLLQTNHFEPRDSPHCDPEVLRANVSSSSGTQKRKRRPKPKVFGDDWITPGNYRKRSKSESCEVRDNVKNEEANRLHIEIVSSSSGTQKRKRRPKPKVFGDDWITPGNYRKRSKSESCEVRDNVKNEEANRLHIEIVSSSSGTQKRKRRPKPKVFGDDWITPGNYRKRSKSESCEVRDNVKNEEANRLHIEIVSSSSGTQKRKRRPKPKVFGDDWITPGNYRKRSKSESCEVRDNVKNEEANRLHIEINRGGNSLAHTTQDLFNEVPIQDSMHLSEPLNTHEVTNGLSSSTPLEGGLLDSICRILSIPTPRSSVFKGWTIILTGGARSNNSPKKSDVNLLQQLIASCGGEIAVEITPALLYRR
uniref:BRCT domain-containing protein n=1 Tax=Trichobilharzia regenti TaxID=157069 RepID=A0AA85JHL2_TRIRE|nr:unnamed protein product [Trichobilharzia regenti]